MGMPRGSSTDEAQPAGTGDPSAAGDLAPALAIPPWLAHGEALAGTSFRAMARRLPALLGAALRLGWQASRRDTVLAVALTLAAGVFTALGVLATRGVAEALFADGATASAYAPPCRHCWPSARPWPRGRR